jgi:Polyketide cyclase / dehydrase and lipid transport
LEGQSVHPVRVELMRYADGPTTEATTIVHAPIETVWALITDINLPARFSTEFTGAEWTGSGPELGATFVGRNHHTAIGGWQTTCTVTQYSLHETFEWCVGEPDHPSATWRFTVQQGADRVVLSQWMRMGPAPSGLTPAIEAMPDKEERIIARRLSEHQQNMQANVDGIKQLAENTSPTAETNSDNTN